MRIKLVGFRCRNQFPADSIEQRIPQLLFRVSEHFADGGLGDIEDFSSPGDRTAGINSLKYLNMTQTHT